jgi:hypothetical protein
VTSSPVGGTDLSCSPSEASPSLLRIDARSALSAPSDSAAMAIFCRLRTCGAARIESRMGWEVSTSVVEPEVDVRRLGVVEFELLLRTEARSSSSPVRRDPGGRMPGVNGRSTVPETVEKQW